jgi:hypothetical protein
MNEQQRKIVDEQRRKEHEDELMAPVWRYREQTGAVPMSRYPYRSMGWFQDQRDREKGTS